MIDPKMVELSMFNGIPHLVMPVVTDSKKASRALRWAVGEMEKRYKLLAAVGARNINTYNERVAEGKLPPARRHGEAARAAGYVVVIVDELADLMLHRCRRRSRSRSRAWRRWRAPSASTSCSRRSVRPSTSSPASSRRTFPSRIAFRVATKTDSRTVLDMNGAENLLGMGDMLFLPMGKADAAPRARLLRLRGGDRRASSTSGAPRPPRCRAAAAAARHRGEHARGRRGRGGQDDFMDDALVPQAACLVVMHNQGSTSLLQRRLKVGYSRAGRLMDQLEQLGVVGPFNGSKARDVLVDQNWLQQKGFE